MVVHTELPRDIEEVDIVIAGGGTAGCIIASRLAETDPNLSVLVVEAGPNGIGIQNVEYPSFFLDNLAPTCPTTTSYKSNMSSNIGDREIIVTTGNVLGGGSAINMMHYSRAQRSDWNSWNTPGWSADDIIPYIKKLESYHGSGPMDYHGVDGPIEISTGTYKSPRLQDQFVSAASELGLPEIDDFFGGAVANGVQRSMRFISRDGKRQDTASQYLQPCLQDGRHPNLHVLVDTRVVKVLVEDKKAVGVLIQSTSKKAPERSVRASKLVVVASGAFGTPAILERSGIGRSEFLKRAGIPQTVELPGVGEGYQDHNLMLYSFKSCLEPEETLDALLRRKWDATDLIRKNHNILGWNGQEVCAKLRPSEEDIALFPMELKEVWENEYQNEKDKPLVAMSLICGYPGDPTGVPDGQYYSVSVFTLYPLSRGYVHVTGPGLDDPVNFETGYLSDEKQVDVKKHRWAYKKHREIVRRMDVFRGEYAPDHPPFPAGSKAVCVELSSPPQDVQSIEYSAEDDAIIDNFVRNRIGTTWHPCGTCKMAPLVEKGVVDSKLSVHGVQALKVADLSIVPKNVAANTNHTALVIGEKAADIIIEELGLSSSDNKSLAL